MYISKPDTFRTVYFLSPLPDGQLIHDQREELKALTLDPVPVYRDTASRPLSTTHRPGEVIRRLTVGRYHPAYRQPNTQSHGTGRAPGVGLGVCEILSFKPQYNFSIKMLWTGIHSFAIILPEFLIIFLKFLRYNS